MWWKSFAILISFAAITISGNFALADCPSTDLTGDCFVDYEDFTLIAAQWLTTDPCVPDDMVYIPAGEFEMGDHNDGMESALPVHAVYVNSFHMSKFEVTNKEYCDYLNSAKLAGDIKVESGIVYDNSDSYPYCDTSTISSYSQIDYNDVSGTFSVRTKGEPPRDMSNDPMVRVSWYGSAAYCNWRSDQEGYEALYDPCDPNWPCDFSKKGYRLATEAEWEYAARGGEHDPYYRFPWGDTINHDYANYIANGSAFSYDTSPYTTYTYHPDWNDGISPYTAPGGSFSANGYGLYDMAGNVWDWCNDWHDSSYYDVSPYDNPTGPASGSYRVLRGGGWYFRANNCRVAYRSSVSLPGGRGGSMGFRVVLDLEPDCPSADLTGDRFVDFEDFALMASQWQTTDPCVPNNMAYIPNGEFEMGDHHGYGIWDELPIHAALLDSFFMSKYEITNRQYCDYLNSAILADDIKVVGGIVYDFNDTANNCPYCSTNSSSTYSQIDYFRGAFSVRTKGSRDMSDDPTVEVSWYGCVAYCNWRSSQEGYQQLYDPCDPNWPCDFSKKGYRLPTEAEWEYAARGGEQSPYYRFPWGDTISHSQANYYSGSLYSYDVSPTSGFHPDWNDGWRPYTSPVDSFSPNGFGLFDMAGNVWEWCNDWYDSNYYNVSPYDNPQGPASGTNRVVRGGCWGSFAERSRVSRRAFGLRPDYLSYGQGFRVVLYLN